MDSAGKSKKYVCPKFFMDKILFKQRFFDIFLRSDFKTLGYDPKGVLIDLEQADRSSLMADSSKAYSRCVIGRILS